LFNKVISFFIFKYLQLGWFSKRKIWALYF